MLTNTFEAAPEGPTRFTAAWGAWDAWDAWDKAPRGALQPIRSSPR